MSHALPPLYAIVDDAASAARGWSPVDVARRFFRAGVRLVQVRAKSASSATFLEWCEAIVAEAATYDARVIVNDRADIALLAGAHGVHVGQDDLDVAAVRRVLGDEATVGVSTHTVAQLIAAAETTASYIAVGPVFGTRTKDTGYQPVGLDLVREAVAHAGGRPVVAIGGITRERAPDVLAAGAASVAVIGDLLVDEDLEARLRSWLRSVAV